MFQLLIAFPVWWILRRGEAVSTVVAISIALSVGTWGMFGAQAALLPELFGARHRYIGVSAAREASAVMAGGIAPFIGAALISWSTTHLGSSKDAWVLIASYGCASKPYHKRSRHFSRQRRVAGISATHETRGRLNCRRRRGPRLAHSGRGYELRWTQLAAGADRDGRTFGPAAQVDKLRLRLPRLHQEGVAAPQRDDD